MASITKERYKKRKLKLFAESKSNLKAVGAEVANSGLLFLQLPTLTHKLGQKLLPSGPIKLYDQGIDPSPW
jgi:hypothetical protein